jgi:hypothetical protein
MHKKNGSLGAHFINGSFLAGECCLGLIIPKCHGLWGLVALCWHFLHGLALTILAPGFFGAFWPEQMRIKKFSGGP